MTLTALLVKPDVVQGNFRNQLRASRVVIALRSIGGDRAAAAISRVDRRVNGDDPFQVFTLFGAHEECGKNVLRGPNIASGP